MVFTSKLFPILLLTNEMEKCHTKSAIFLKNICFSFKQLFVSRVRLYESIRFIKKNASQLLSRKADIDAWRSFIASSTVHSTLALRLML
ncbi:hypothetical protein AA984_02525 [Brevibacillus formosus]|uniref:Uncharacterized protein n=1 Tax=Brevibacillus formosus TaxID=54913 RepID=A0A837KV56_9BACL|nr:hypothetical protein AA984_02525 [Brevibacillus formosus]PSK00516.1 hypothetical protein C7R91_02485 [Brevibacillus formosus]